MKHLPKHLQPRWRYLAVELRSDGDATLGRNSFQRNVWFAAQNLVGDVGSAAADLSVVRFEFGGGDGQAVVRARREETDRARAVLACIDEVDGTQVGVRVTGIGGTIRACVDTHLAE